MAEDIVKYENLLVKVRKDINLLKDLVHDTRLSVSSSHDGENVPKKEFENKCFTKIEEILDSSDRNIRDVLPGHSNDGDGMVDFEENSIFATHSFTKNHVILRVIFGFLDLPSIKNCRLVNTTWKDTSKLFFERNVVVSFTRDRTVQKFMSDFDDNNRWKCGRYKFSNMTLLLSEVRTLFNHDLSILTSLTLFEVALKDGHGVHTNDLNGLLGDIRLKKLVIYNWNKSEKVIALGKLSSVEYLDLFGCKITVNEENDKGTICCPTFLKLDHVSFRKPTGDVISKSLANDLFDFSKCTTIKIRSVKPIVSLNLESARQKIDTVNLRGMTLATNKLLQITNLKFDIPAVDLSILPNTLEKLEFNGHLRVVFQSDQANPVLPNLEILCISKMKRSVRFLNKFSNCSKLKFVKLEKIVNLANFEAENFYIDCDFTWLPPSVETLQLNNVFSKEGATFEHLKNLVIRSCFMPPSHYLRRRVLVDNLYISLDEDLSATRGSELCRDMLEDRIFRNKLVIEGFDWQNEREFRTDPLRQIVDKMSICYSFEEDRGKAISFIPPYLSPYNMEQSNSYLESKYFQRYLME